jgi:hypothetical protein
VEITLRDAVTVLHGMLFGALLLLGLTGAAIAVYATTATTGPWSPTARQRRLLSTYLIALTVLAWLAVLLGAYVVYPWYRAHLPAGAVNLADYPQRLLMSSPTTSGWHDLGMEWKEHIAWFAPLSVTAATYIFVRYGEGLRSFRSLRNAALALIALAFVSGGVAGFFGAMLNKYAPVRGGGTLTLMQGESHE